MSRTSICGQTSHVRLCFAYARVFITTTSIGTILASVIFVFIRVRYLWIPVATVLRSAFTWHPIIHELIAPVSRKLPFPHIFCLVLATVPLTFQANPLPEDVRNDLWRLVPNKATVQVSGNQETVPFEIYFVLESILHYELYFTVASSGPGRFTGHCGLAG